MPRYTIRRGDSAHAATGKAIPLLACGRRRRDPAAAAPAQNVSRPARGHHRRFRRRRRVDRTARVVQKSCRRTRRFPASASPTVTAAAGTGAWTSLEHAGDVAQHRDFLADDGDHQSSGCEQDELPGLTPLSVLLREYIVVTVSADPPITSGKVLLELYSQGHPTALSFAFLAAPASQPRRHRHDLQGRVADPEGEVVIRSRAGRARPRARRPIDVLVGAPAACAAPLKAYSGKMRAIGFSAPKRQPGAAAGLPTMREQA